MLCSDVDDGHEMLLFIINREIPFNANQPFITFWLLLYKPFYPGLVITAPLPILPKMGKQMR
ncbi:MAG: hypothetical protein KQI35_01285 [Bacteroidetes bacterium]|nr:hypothetical protein [Bacteroidota bacterium]